MRYRVLIFSTLLVFFFTACSTNQPQVTPAPSIHNEVTATPKGTQVKPTGDVDEPNFNPYNFLTATDDEYVYYTALTGIFKVPHGGKGAEKLVDGEAIASITLHNSTIYYKDNADLCRVDKDGSNQRTLDIGHRVSSVTCRNDTLYILTLDDGTLDGVYYAADIASDSDVLTLKKQPKGCLAPNGDFYSREHIEGTELSTLYHISFENNKKTAIISDTVIIDYIVTDQFIYVYEVGGNIFKSDLDGQNYTKILEPIWQFYNYDNDWVYFKSEDGIERIHQYSGLREPLNWTSRFFDIVDDYLYGLDYSQSPVNVIRMLLPNGSLEYAPFE